MPAVATRQKIVANISAPASDEQKLRGGYYTPQEIAYVLAKWAICKPNAEVLEPSCGDGQFIEAASQIYGDRANITGVELFEGEARKARRRGNVKTSIFVSDAFTWFLKGNKAANFDAVIGNPPFIRYQNFPEKHRDAAFRIMQDEGLSPSRLTNAWLPFVVLATRALRKGGRLAMVLPAELMQVSYAAELRGYLAKKFSSLTLVTFRQLIFSGIQQETVLLLGERGDNEQSSLAFVELDDLRQLNNDVLDLKRNEAATLDHENEKWTKYYLSPEELTLIRSVESKNFRKLGSMASIDVGIVTGNNDFFILSRKDAADFGIEKNCIPIVGRSGQLLGVTFTAKDKNLHDKSSHGSLLLNLGNTDRSKLSSSARSYVLRGEKLGAHEGYKCRIRQPNWWKMPSIWRPDAFMLRQINEGPRIIHNATAATCTDTIHRVRMISDTDPKVLAAASVNSLTFAFAEILGRSYGGGVLELEPSEAEALPVPIDSKTVLPTEAIDSLVRQKEIEKAMDIVDDAILRPVGFSSSDIKKLRGIWRKLCGRRLGRKQRTKAQ